MDIVSRLKLFMNSLNISSTQFADSCHIPRPSLSQLLNGRNKKVSDEIITKIHEAYPDLSVSWLLFGEGSMDSTPNIQFSEPQNDPVLPFDDLISADNQYNSPGDSHNFNSPNFSQNSFTSPSAHREPTTPPFPNRSITDSQPSTLRSPAKSEISTAFENPNAKTSSHSINLKASPNKRITNIVVFYDDNSFESFNPSTT